MKRNGFRLSVLAAALCLSATGAYAAGLGKITVLSPLGQPLRAEIDVNASPDELVSMNARLASPDAFRQVGIEYVQSVSSVRFALDKRRDGQPFLRMTSDRPINDAFLDVLVELTWSSGRMVREYTVLLDPPEGLSPATPVPVAAPKTTKPAAAPVVVAPAREATPAAAPAPAASTKSAPATAPAPVPAAPSAAGAESGIATRLVKSGDTLSKIAAATKPEGVSLDQMLVALLQGNQGAFDGGNMNRLRAGKILTVPTAETVAAVVPSEARQVISAQARDFSSYRSRLAASVAATPPVKDMARQQDQGKIAPKVADKATTPESGKDKLEVSRTETAKDAKAVQGRITALEEDLVARDRALKEAHGRVAELERNLSDLKKLAELKNQPAAQLQKQAEAAKPAAVEVKPPEVKVPEVKVPEVKPEAKPEVKPEVKPAAPEPVTVKPLEPVAPVEAPKPADVPAVPPVVEPPPPAKAAEPAPSAEEPSFADENPALVYGGGGLVALLLGYLGFSALRRKRGDNGPPTVSRLSEGDLMANSVFGTTGGQSVDTSASIQTDFSQASLSAIDTDEGVDPVAEADVYMAYGRDAQAEEILLDALKSDPSRLAIYLKLLEIYSGSKNLPQFGKIASDLHSQTGGAGPEWDKAAAMGRAIDPANSLYSDASAVATTEPEPMIPSTEVEPFVAPLSASLPMDNTVTLPGQLAQLAAAAEHPAATPANLGFDLDLGVPPVATKAAAEVTGVDLNLDTQSIGHEASPAVQDLDIDLSMPNLPGETAPASRLSVADPAAPSGLDFEFDLDAPQALASSGVAAAPAMDFSGINLDLVTAAPAVDEVVVATPVTIADDGEDADVTTKIELAQAYEEMGDREGARELLQEVLQEGSVRQQETARARLAALDA
jgi:pilus assembly protein FimV